MVYPDWDAVADNSRPFLLYCNASVDGFGATLEQGQKDGSIRPIVFISIKRLRRFLWGTTVRIFSDNKALESLARVAEHNPRVQRWL